MLVRAAIAAALIGVLVLSTTRGSRIDTTTLFVAPSSVVLATVLHETALWALSRGGVDPPTTANSIVNRERGSNRPWLIMAAGPVDRR
ncbi:hypothetical protein AB0C04_29120 [Micromonospora sp. NPDC048909]|uniref:hypothetical protein n=1 Tax=Micromonospora sp. NPDC048909 TaxID=3155643 RepID=UPI0033D976E6